MGVYSNREGQGLESYRQSQYCSQFFIAIQVVSMGRGYFEMLQEVAHSLIFINLFT